MVPYWVAFLISTALASYPAWIANEETRTIIHIVQFIAAILLTCVTGIQSDSWGSAAFRRIGSTVLPYLTVSIGTATIRSGNSKNMWMCLVIYGLLLMYQVSINIYALRMHQIDQEVGVIMIRRQEEILNNPNVGQVVVELSKVESPSDEEWSCSICLMSNYDDDIAQRRCGHIYHTLCALKAAEYSSKCPLCRFDDNDMPPV